MRTTLTLDSDVVGFIQDAVHRERRSMKQVINDALRRSLAPSPDPKRKPYKLIPHDSALQPGIDFTSLNRLADELEDEAILFKIRDGK